jgi:hypothetical protein
MKYFNCKKIRNICFFDKLGPFLKEHIWFLWEGTLLPRELGPFPKENSLLPKEVVFFIGELFSLHEKLVWD